MTLELVEYEITLATREKIPISELDVERIEPGPVRDYIASRPQTLARCTWASRRTLEQAKRGYDRPLRDALSTPPFAALMKLEPSVCSHYATCSSYNPEACRTGYQRKKKSDFPLCWTYETADAAERDVVGAVVAAWRDGRTVVIVSG